MPLEIDRLCKYRRVIDMRADSLEIENLHPIVETTKELDKMWLYCIIGIIIFFICLIGMLWTYFHSERLDLKRHLQQKGKEPDFKNIMDSAFRA